jgi:SAM-dependent methyltransferase
MTKGSYTPGHGANATDFMAGRSLPSHGEFFLPYLTPGVSVLDCGCGPGTITLGIAERVAPAKVIGIDFEPSQIERAAANAVRAAVGNLSFRTADCHALPFGTGTFDRVFSHALMEHVPDPVRVLRELHRVLVPEGVVGVCSPDWGGFLLAPDSPALSNALESYKTLQSRNGGDVHVGRKLGLHLAAGGFAEVRMAARFECYSSLGFIGEYLALQLERAGDHPSAELLRAWSRSDGGMFAQAWVWATGRKR